MQFKGIEWNPKAAPVAVLANTGASQDGSLIVGVAALLAGLILVATSKFNRHKKARA